MNDLVVAKFGGTSMGTVSSMRACAQIVLQNPRLRLVVVSATSGTTSQLVELANCAEQGDWERAQKICADVSARHLSMAQELKLTPEALITVQEILNEMQAKAQGMHLLREAGARSRDGLYSIGERLSSLLFTAAIPSAVHLDVRSVMKTDTHFGQANVNIELLKKNAQFKLPELWENHAVVVTQGYIGETVEGITTTLGRGGSDYSAALLAEALNAQHVEIWTDVSGMYTIDPKITAQAQAIHEISFEEAAEMCTFGAKVLHPATLWPAMRQFIPVYVGNSFAPKTLGTWVRRETSERPSVRAISVRDKQKILTLTSLSMLHAHGFLQKIFSILANHHISVDLITTSEISVALTIDKPVLLTCEILAELETVAEVKLEENLSVVALIGNDIPQNAGLVSELFSALSAFSIRMICLGAGRHNLCLIVDSTQAQAVAKILHQLFLEKTTAPEVAVESWQ